MWNLIKKYRSSTLLNQNYKSKETGQELLNCNPKLFRSGSFIEQCHLFLLQREYAELFDENEDSPYDE